MESEFKLSQAQVGDHSLKALIDRPYLVTEKYQEQQWRCEREGAHPDIVEFEKSFIRWFYKNGVPMFAHCMVRTRAEQAAAYVRGTSRNDGSKPYPHQAFAVDIIHSVKGWQLPEQSWNLIGHAGKEVAKRLSIPIVWGGDFETFYDPAHWELAHWRTMQPIPPFMSKVGKT